MHSHTHVVLTSHFRSLSFFSSFFSLFHVITEWTNKAEHILARLAFADSGMDVTDTYLSMEAAGLSTDRLPVQGLVG
jgi:hypothetical protein